MWAGFVIASLLGVGCSTPALSTEVATALRGRTVRILVGFAAGGGYDLHARVLASHLSRHLPGQPMVIVENMPGAGGLVAANHLAMRAEPDGLTVGIVGLYAVLAQLLNRPGVQFDVRDFRAIGSPSADAVDVCVMSKASGIDLAGWRGRPTAPRLGFTASGASNHVRGVLLASALELPIHAVVGYQGNADVRLAMESGEVDGTCLGLLSYRSTFEASANDVIVLTSNESESLGLESVPAASRLVAEASGKELLDVLAQLRTLDRYYVVPRGTRPGLIATFRQAFNETMADSAFLQDARAARLDIRPVRFAHVEARVTALLSIPPASRQRISLLIDRQETRP